MEKLTSVLERIAINIEKKRDNQRPKPSIEKLSKQADISIQTLMKIKNRQADNITISTLVGIANALNCSLNDLVK